MVADQTHYSSLRMSKSRKDEVLAKKAKDVDDDQKCLVCFL